MLKKRRKKPDDYAKTAMAYGISIGAHLVLLLIAAKIGFALMRPAEHEKPLRVTFRKPIELPKPEPKKIELPKPKGKDEKEPLPKVPEPKPDERAAVSPDEHRIKKPLEVASNVDLKQLARNIIAPGAAGGDKVNLYGGRNAHRRGRLLSAGGAPRGSEATVRVALDWLARHQDNDGKWSPDEFWKHCPKNDRCSGVPRYRTKHAGLGVTGLAMLAYLGRGYTHRVGERTRRDSRYTATVSKGLQYILKCQHDDGHFSRQQGVNNYVNGICTLVLVEAYALTGDESLVSPLTRGIRFLVGCQQEAGGWNYNDKPTDRNDTSVTSWVVLALKAARAINVKTPWETDYGLFRFVNTVTSDDGTAYYKTWGDKPPHRNLALTAGTLMCRLYLGLDDTPMTHLQAALISSDPPMRSKLTTKQGRDHTYYYWYYGTLSMFAMGGDYWKKWNRPMTNALMSLQSKRGHESGSWDPKPSRWTMQTGGRVMATAMAALDMEIYYRYLRTTDRARRLRLEEFLLTGLQRDDLPIEERITLMKHLVFIDRERAVSAAAGDLADESMPPAVRSQAAMLLARFNDPRCVKPLLELAANKELLEGRTLRNTIRGLGMASTEETLKRLVELLEDESHGESDSVKNALFLATGTNFGFKKTLSRRTKARLVTGWRRRIEAVRDRLEDMRKARIYCEVGAMSGDGKYIFLDAGSRDGVRFGQSATITTDDFDYAAGKVTHVFENTCRVTMRKTSDKVKLGDPALIRLRAKAPYKRKASSETKRAEKPTDPGSSPVK